MHNVVSGHHGGALNTNKRNHELLANRKINESSRVGTAQANSKAYGL